MNIKALANSNGLTFNHQLKYIKAFQRIPNSFNPKFSLDFRGDWGSDLVNFSLLHQSVIKFCKENFNSVVNLYPEGLGGNTWGVYLLSNGSYWNKKYYLLTINLIQYQQSDITLLSPDDSVKKFISPIQKIIEPFIPKNQEKENTVAIKIANSSPNGIMTRTLQCEAFKWDTIKENYSQQVEQNFSKLINNNKPWQYGKLVFLHGPPGTGKTTAIRSLMLTWKKKFVSYVISDPEVFMGNPGYYYDICEDNEEFYTEEEKLLVEIFGTDKEKKEIKKETEVRKHNLFIIEDAADFFILGARAAHWDKVGKFLNLSDGILGQGRNDIFVISFNEEKEEIDPAFLRPGRCIAEIFFDKFERDQANEWLKNHNVPFETRDEMSLAELYHQYNLCKK